MKSCKCVHTVGSCQKRKIESMALLRRVIMKGVAKCHQSPPSLLPSLCEQFRILSDSNLRNMSTGARGVVRHAMLVQGCRGCDGRSSDRQGSTHSTYLGCRHYISRNTLISRVIVWVGPCFNGPGSASVPLVCCISRVDSNQPQHPGTTWLTGADVSNQSTARGSSDVSSKS